MSNKVLWLILKWHSMRNGSEIVNWNRMWNMLQIYGIYELYTHEMTMEWILQLYNEMWIEIFVKQMKYDMVVVIIKY